MASEDLPRDVWPEFLEGFSRRHKAWLATVDQIGGVIGRAGPAEAPLAAVTMTRDGGRVGAIEIAFAGNGHVPLRVEHPTSVRVRRTPEGVESGLEIVDDEGVCTRVGFRTAPRPEMLDGVAPGEV